MSTDQMHDFVNRAETIYNDRLKDLLEPTHLHQFVAVEPDSGDYYLGRTLSEALGAARAAHPDRLAHAMRVGHKAALHFGLHRQ